MSGLVGKVKKHKLRGYVIRQGKTQAPIFSQDLGDVDYMVQDSVSWGELFGLLCVLNQSLLPGKVNEGRDSGSPGPKGESWQGHASVGCKETAVIEGPGSPGGRRWLFFALLQSAARTLGACGQ